jgi:uracil-DNA glycosylase
VTAHRKEVDVTDIAMLPEAWRGVLGNELQQPYFKELTEFVEEERAKGPVYPPREEVFAALDATPYERVKVLVLGQDPYHGEGQGHGLCFSVRPGVKTPPSLRNIYKEMKEELGHPVPDNGYLMPWARQGVLLLNATLTVEDGRPASHARHGWEALTDGVIEALARDRRPKAFLLWGLPARACVARIAAAGAQHLVLQANHPSPLSATRQPLPFIGCGHFARARDFVRAHSAEPFDWALP